MIKRTIIAIAISLVGWTGLQMATTVLIPPATMDSPETSLPLVGSIDLTWQVHAQTGRSSRLTLAQPVTGTLTETLTAEPAQNLTDTTPISITTIVTESEPVATDESLADTAEIPIPEEPITPTEATNETTLPDPVDDPVVDAALPEGQTDLTGDNPVLGIVDGTILANRTDMTIKFFVEGQIYEVATLRSIGLDLPRSSTVLNLYNCDTSVPETEEGCYWDPYMVDRFGFYDIVVEDGISGIAKVTLSEAGGPSGATIWIQNKSPQAEIIVYRNVIFDLLPGALREFAVGDDALPTFFVRSCLEVDGDSACEWVPIVATVGLRYALVETETSGGLPNSRVSMLDLLPLDENGEVIVAPEVAPQETADAGATDEAPPAASQVADPALAQGSQMMCTVLVPALNVRSGPGLEYEIIAKVRGTETEVGTVLIIGRDVTSEWLAVDEVVAPGGWITGSPNFVACDNAISSLAITEITDGRLAPVEPVVAEETVTDNVAQADAEAGGEVVEGEEAAAEEAVAEVVVPKGQALLNINNGFDQELRFTLDQRFRVQEGPSEYDLGPGDSVQIFVYPGLIGFSASTPWRGLSANNDFLIEEEQSRELWLYFVPDPDGSDSCKRQYYGYRRRRNDKYRQSRDNVQGS